MRTSTRKRRRHRYRQRKVALKKGLERLLNRESTCDIVRRLMGNLAPTP